MLENSHQVYTWPRFIAVGIARSKQRNFSLGASSGLGHDFAVMSRKPLAQGIAVVFRQLGIRMHAQHNFQSLARWSKFIGRINHLHYHRDTRQIANSIGAAQDAIASFYITIFEFEGLGAQHQMREVHIPFMRWRIRTFGHVTQIAHIAVIHHLHVIRFFYAIHFHGGRLIYQVEHGRKRFTQAHATTASVADIKYPLHLIKQLFLIGKVGIKPIQGMACRC